MSSYIEGAHPTAHRVSLSPSGRLVFHDHPSGWIRFEAALIAMGAEPECSCPEILRLWRNRRYDLLPPELRAAGRKSRERGKARWAAVVEQPWDPLSIPLSRRREIREWDAMRRVTTKGGSGLCRTSRPKG